MHFSRSFKTAAALLAVSALLVAAPTLFAQDAQTKADVTAVVTSNTQFAFAMYQNLNADKSNKGKNIFLSPYSISTALAMTYLGSEGNTRTQMAGTLHFNLPDNRLEAGFSSLLGQTKATPDKHYKLDVANALWGQQDYHFEPAFTGAIGKYFDGGFNAVNYADDQEREAGRIKINRWVEQKTNDKIKNLVHPDDINNLTRLILTNAIYFKGDWKLQFKTMFTQNAPFTVSPGKTVTVPMMAQKEHFPFMENSELKMIELPYAGDDLSMLVLLPAGDVEKFGAALTPEKLQEYQKQLFPVKVELSLPRFKFETRYTLNEGLAAMGMPDAFDRATANFAGMTGKPALYITAVIHQAMIDVNEEGSEAAGATAVVMGEKAMVMRPVVFRADRPFIFMIVHKPTGAILFMGRLSDPPPAANAAAPGK